MSAPVLHSTQVTSGALGPAYFGLLHGPQNVGVYPISWSSGVRLIDVFPASPRMNDLRVRDGYLFWTGTGFGFSGRSITHDLFEVVDVFSAPYRVVASVD